VKTPSIQKQPIADRVGIDPRFEDVPSFGEIFVAADIGATAHAFAKDVKAIHHFEDAFNRSIPVTGKGVIFYLIQFRGHLWTRISGPLCPPIFGDARAKSLSAKLNCKVVFWFFEDVSCSLGYELFDSSKSIERFIVLPDSPATLTSSLRKASKAELNKNGGWAWVQKLFVDQRIYAYYGFDWDLMNKQCTLSLRDVEQSDIVGVHLVEASWKATPSH
jgi:hypothetical protein